MRLWRREDLSDQYTRNVLAQVLGLQKAQDALSAEKRGERPASAGS